MEDLGFQMALAREFLRELLEGTFSPLRFEMRVVGVEMRLLLRLK